MTQRRRGMGKGFHRLVGALLSTLLATTVVIAGPIGVHRAAAASRSAIAAGSYHSFVVSQAAHAWGFGDNYSGQIGSDTNVGTIVPNTPHQSDAVFSSVGVAAGLAHTLLVTGAGKVVAYGDDSNGQAGYDANLVGHVPQNGFVVPGLPDVVQVAAGELHSLALDVDGTVWGWGANDLGQLGVAGPADHPTPVRVPGLTNVASIAAGSKFSLAVRRDGTVWTWGDNSLGQLGRPSGASVAPSQVAGLAEITSVAGGSNFSMALDRDGRVWTFGGDGVGQLGRTSLFAVPTPTVVDGVDHVVRIAAGALHGVAVKTDGTVWTWGLNDRGQLGRSTATTSAATPAIVPGITNAEDAAASGTLAGKHTLVLLGDGTLRTFGDDTYGQLGVLAAGGSIPQTPMFVDGGPVIPAGQGAWYRAKTPLRFLDTRAAPTFDANYQGLGRRSAGQITRVPIGGRGGVPLLGTVTLNVTAVDPSADGYLTMFACASTNAVPTPPNASTLNFAAHHTIANAGSVLILGPGSGGDQLCIYTSAATDLVLDVEGAAPLVDVTVDYLLAFPLRFLDTRPAPTFDSTYSGIGVRPAGSMLELPVVSRYETYLGPVSATNLGVPHVAGAILNVTVTDPASAGYVTVWPCGQAQPTASNLNFAAGQTIANSVTVQTGDLGKICFYTSAKTQLIVDSLQLYAVGKGFVPAGPTRLADTRSAPTFDGRVQGGGPVLANNVLHVPVAGRAGVPLSASAAVLNVTVVGAHAAGYVTAWPCGETQPTASNVNFDTGSTIAGSATIRPGSNGEICLYTSADTDLIVDLDGYWR